MTEDEENLLMDEVNQRVAAEKTADAQWWIMRIVPVSLFILTLFTRLAGLFGLAVFFAFGCSVIAFTIWSMRTRQKAKRARKHQPATSQNDSSQPTSG